MNPEPEELRRWIELCEERAAARRIAKARLLRVFLAGELVVDPGKDWDALAAFLRDCL